MLKTLICFRLAVLEDCDGFPGSFLLWSVPRHVPVAAKMGTYLRWDGGRVLRVFAPEQAPSGAVGVEGTPLAIGACRSRHTLREYEIVQSCVARGLVGARPRLSRGDRGAEAVEDAPGGAGEE